MSENATPTNQEIATINGKHYFKDSMSKEQVEAFNQAIQIHEQIESEKITIRNLQYAQQFIVDILDKEKDTMKEYIPETSDDVAETETETERCANE